MQFLMVDVYYEKEICYSDNINKKAEYKWSDQMEAAQRIRLIRIIEKMERNSAFSNKLALIQRLLWFLRLAKKPCLDQTQSQ